MSVNFKNLNSINVKLEQYKNSKLLIVTKNQQIEDIKLLYEKGYSFFGENRIQEAKKKYFHLDFKKDIKLSLIGPIQSNKLVDALEIFDSIQSIDRIKIIDLISKIKKTNKHILTEEFFLQVNIGNEKQKSGFRIEEIEKIYKYSISLNLPIVGFMCIPPNNDNSDFYFQKMLELRNRINPNLLLSMGMSNDFKIALQNKSDIIRIGSLIFND